MPISIHDHYRRLIKHSGTIVEAMLADEEAVQAITVSHNYLLDFGLLKQAITNRPEKNVLDAAVKEYQLALFALASGQYRYAFAGLRLFFELMLATVQFSAREIDYRLWAKDSKDINWSALIDTQSGVFSRNFMQAFNPEFEDSLKQYSAISAAVYRECSEFVHGNAGTHTTLPTDIEFHRLTFFDWHDKAKTMKMVIVYVFCARYINYISAEAKNAIEPVAMDSIGHLAAIQALFSTS
jgi:hypothetical protein